MPDRQPRPLRLHSRIPELPGVGLAFNDPAAAYQKRVPHHLPRLNDNLRDKLRQNFDSARDLAERLEEGRFDRLKNGRIVADNAIRRWQEYVVLQDHGSVQTNNARVKDFLARVMAQPGIPVQAALEVYKSSDTRLPFISEGRGKFRTLVTFADIAIEGGAVRPQIDIDYDTLESHQSKIRDLIGRHNSLLVVGYYTLGRVGGSRKNPVFLLKTQLGHPDLMTAFDYENILKKGRAAEARRRARDWLKPYQFGG